MKKALCIAAIAAALIIPTVASAQQIVQVCLRDGSRPGDHLRMRTYPAENAPTLERAFHGEAVAIVRYSGSFALVMDYNGTRGWVPRRYLCAF